MALEQEIFETLFLETETALKNGDWETAKENVEKIKKVNPNNAKALYFEFLASQKLHNESEIFSYSGLIKDDKLFQKAYALADVELKKELDEIVFKNSFKAALEKHSKKTKKMKKRRANLLNAIAMIESFAENAEAQEKVETWKIELAETEDKIAIKKKKRKKLTIITTSAIALVIGLILLYIYVISPFIDYTIATKKMKEKDYAVAYGRFLYLDDYRDSEILVKEAGYNLALDLIKQEQYVSAYELLLKYGDPDTEEYKLCMYHTALIEKESSQYDKAIEKFNKLGDYKDSVNLQKESKYLYIKANCNNNNENTYKYLLELKDEKYQDCEKIYAELYTWEAESWVTIYGDFDACNDLLKRNGKEPLTLEEYKILDCSEANLRIVNAPYCFNFILKGGIPGELTRVKWVINNMGEKSEVWHPRMVEDGYWMWYTIRSADDVGTISVKIYDEYNNIIAEDSIKCK